ncbi:hypothetical protein [Nitrolancea hollandica]|uniref:Uncharacterized protein n=1 Tax=Nitrolancea hollandica Lb TaxID=1129897 RepID=I4EG37_9BACT|nr:hypothetical protein [Nitrolancea hollandica]CCF83649.1 hypothetical protein NITHO_2520024 [Nitrolancea hollandica Lb]
MPLNLNIDPNDFTLGDIEDFEAYCGQPFELLLGKGAVVSGKMLTALIWVIKRREDPSYTTEQARTIKLSDFTQDPTLPAPNETDSAADS